MDGCGIFRPWKYNYKWLTKNGWLHFDQNWTRNKKFECYQGLLNLCNVTNQTGGFYCIPKSHKEFNRFGEKYENKLYKKKFGICFIPKHDPLYAKKRLILGMLLPSLSRID